ncbi:MAG TPA: ferritin [Spirochaetota bacterium]|nr:ferritin [Spirochaetota bacterium]HOM38570.1 ferritin [Spirochaetota bacterium]HPQ49707.1 ferritin [Spirochaetota bacterium]
MKISKKMQNAINEQINKELYSEYLYINMACYFFDNNLSGFGNFFLKQAEEEREHAMKFFKYVYERRGSVKLKEIKKPDISFNSILSVFEKALEHEEYVTKSIYELVNIAREEKDEASLEFLNWFVKEQVEEEANMDQIVNMLKMGKDNPNFIMLLDSKLGERK